MAVLASSPASVTAPTRISELLRQLSELDRDEPYFLLRAAEVGEEVEATLSDPAVLRAAALAIADQAHRVGCETIVGASSSGDRLAGAVVAVDGALHLWGTTSGSRPVMVVDHVLITGFALAEVASRVEAAGAQAITGCVLAASFASGYELPGSVSEIVVADLA